MDAAGPKPTAANPGTLLSVEDLFFNMPLRKKVHPGPPASTASAVCSALPFCLVCSAAHPTAELAAMPN